MHLGELCRRSAQCNKLFYNFPITFVFDICYDARISSFCLIPLYRFSIPKSKIWLYSWNKRPQLRDTTSTLSLLKWRGQWRQQSLHINLTCSELLVVFRTCFWVSRRIFIITSTRFFKLDILSTLLSTQSKEKQFQRQNIQCSSVLSAVAKFCQSKLI